jgi:hypothetical protein
VVVQAAAQLSVDPATGKAAIPVEWLKSKEDLAKKVKALEAGMHKAIRYSRISRPPEAC